MRFFAIPLLFVLLLPLAAAHVPVLENANHTSPQVLSNSVTQQLVLGELATPQDVDIYLVPGAASQRLQVQMLIPQLAGEEQFMPVMALFWRQLPSNDLQSRQFNADPTLPPTEYADPDTGAVFWQRQGFTAELNAAGTYAIVVASEKNETGKYALAIGNVTVQLNPLEAAAATDKINAWLGKPSLNPLLVGAIALIAIGIIVLIAVYAHARKPKHAWQRWRKRK